MHELASAFIEVITRACECDNFCNITTKYDIIVLYNCDIEKQNADIWIRS